MGNMDLFELTGKKALVTGGSIGIGRGFALALAQAGADVAIIARNEIAGNSVVEEIKALGRESFLRKIRQRPLAAGGPFNQHGHAKRVDRQPHV